MSYALSTTATADPDQQPAIDITFSFDDALHFRSTDEAFDYVDKSIKGNLALLRELRDQKRHIDRQITTVQDDNRVLQAIATDLTPHL